MDGSTGKITVREAVGAFRDPDALNGAISDLVSAGVRRAELSLLSQEGILDGNLAKNYRNTRTARS